MRPISNRIRGRLCEGHCAGINHGHANHLLFRCRSECAAQTAYGGPGLVPLRRHLPPGELLWRRHTDPLAFNDPTHARWNNHDTLVSLTQDANDTIIAPIYAVRLNCSSYSSGTITLQIGYPDQI